MRILKSKNKIFTNIKSLISIKNIDINKIVAFNKFSFVQRSFEYFIGYKDAKKNRPLCIFLPKVSKYIKDFDKTKFDIDPVSKNI